MFQTIVNLALVATFVVYVLILLVMWRSTRAQNLLNLVVYLSQESLRDDRRVVIDLGKQRKQFVGWSDGEVKAAGRVCASYNLAGLLAKDKAIPTETFVTAYADSLRKCFASAEELLKAYRSERGAGYWKSFDWLVSEAKRLAPPEKHVP
jgi:hypothetical protein